MSKDFADDLGDSLALLKSDEWKQYILFIRARGKKLQEDVNRAVAEGQMDDAKAALAVMKDNKKQVATFIENVTTRANEKREK